MDRFVVKSDFKPTGDQPAAINEIVNRIQHGEKRRRIESEYDGQQPRDPGDYQAEFEYG